MMRERRRLLLLMISEKEESKMSEQLCKCGHPLSDHPVELGLGFTGVCWHKHEAEDGIMEYDCGCKKFEPAPEPQMVSDCCKAEIFSEMDRSIAWDTKEGYTNEVFCSKCGNPCILVDKEQMEKIDSIEGGIYEVQVLDKPAAHKVPTVEEICRILSSNTNKSCFEHGMDARHFYYFYPNDLETIATAIHNLMGGIK